MAALNNVIYGDCRSASISSTLSSFLSLGSPPKKKIEYSCGYDPSLFINQEEIEKYICPICQHVVKEAMNIGCGNNHIFCSKCFDYQPKNIPFAGAADGATVGDSLGVPDGLVLGTAEGDTEGIGLGTLLGTVVGSLVGI